ncbi:IS1634 family transposase [Altericista sp. CCNU0014]|uniref:IS1634 family transposase n=1 Tax=Altericista sp. CCNU0014 TaxID=3082949 RepID=UPI00384E58CB
MSSIPQEIQVQNLDHLGIVAGIIDEIGLVEQVDELLGIHPQAGVTLGQILKAMILNGLGFVSVPLYLFSQFFEGKAIEHLLGKGIEASHLNDDRLGRALDRFYEYGVTNLFTTLALKAAQQFGVETERVHLDSTSMSVEGQYVPKDSTVTQVPEEAQPISAIALTYGYSRDRRPDLKQFLMDTICSGDGDVPLYLRVADGNEVDGVGFRTVIHEYRQDWSFDGLRVADAALFTAENLKQMGSLKWVSRVPLTLNQAQEVIAQVTPSVEWKGVGTGYRLIGVCTTYAGIRQRWVVVESDQRKDADLKQLQKRVEQQEHRQRRHLEQLCKESFACEADAIKAINAFEQTLHYCQLTDVSVLKKVHHGKRGRPKSDAVCEERFYPQATLVHNIEAIAAQQSIVGRFILATNVLDCDELSAVEVLQEYKNQQSSERGFRFLKDPLFFTSSVFLKSQERIMALAMVMALCLLVYTLAQRKLRKALSEAHAGIPNQLGKMTDTPTMKWVFQCFQAIHLVVVSGHRQVSNLSPQRLKILQFLGASCGRYYLLE